MKIFMLMVVVMVTDTANGFTRNLTLSHEEKLIKTFLGRYRKRGTYGRPINEVNETVVINYNMQLIQIVDLDEKNQVLTLNVWDKYMWTDIHMQWIPEKHGGVDKIHLSSSKIWIPDIKLYNFADVRLSERREALCVIDYNGTVLWKPQAIYKSSCELDVTSFPFDIQRCTLKFGAWTHDGNLVDLMVLINETGHTNGSIDMVEYVESNSWVLLHTRAIRHAQYYTCCPGVPYIDLSFTIIFQRRATFYNYILILPCILLTSLTLVLFWIPPDSPAKMMLGINIFVAFFLLLLVMENNLPPAASKVPLLGTFYSVNMVLITLSSFLNAFVVNFYFYGARRLLPSCLRMVMYDFFAKILCMDSVVNPFRDQTISELTSRMGRPRIPVLGMPFTTDRSSKWVRSDARSSRESMLLNIHQIEHDQQSFMLQHIYRNLGELVDFMKAYRTRATDRDRKERIAKEWKAVSLLFDRIFFIIYLITIITSLSVILPIITNPEVDLHVE